MSEEASTIARVIEVAWAPSTALSSTPVAVTVWAVSQFELVNVNWAGDTVASPVLADVTDMTTSEEGWVLSTTVKVSVLPDSVVDVEPSDSETETPGESSSEVVTVTVWSATESNASSEEASTTETVSTVV